MSIALVSLGIVLSLIVIVAIIAYDYDRYDSDDDYAAGVDDAMDEDYEEW